MAKYKLITELDETRFLGRTFAWKKINNSQDRLKEAYDLGLTSFVEKIEDKPEKKEGILKNPLSKSKNKKS